MNKKPKATFHHPKKRDDKNAVAIVKVVPQLGCVSQDSDALVSQRGKQSRETRCKKSWDPVEKYGSLSLRYVKSVSRKRIDHRLENYKSNLNISEVPTLQNSRTGPMKRLKDKSDVPEAALGTLPKTYTSSMRTIKLHSTRLRKSGYSFLRQQKRRRQESDHEDIEESDDGDDGNGDVETREEATENVKQVDLFVKVMLLEETPAVLSLGKLCEDHGYTYHWISNQKPHLVRYGKRIDCNFSNYVPFCGSWFISGFFLNCTFHYFSIIFITGFRI